MLDKISNQPQVIFNDNKESLVILEVASTPEKMQTGLMRRDILPEGHGMVFIFRPIRTTFMIMKNTFIPLDMIFILNGKIVNLAKNAKPNQEDIRYLSMGEVSEVIEVNAGFIDKHKLKIGNKVEFVGL